MKFLESYPSRKLSPFVKSYWCMTGYLVPGQSLISRDIPNGDHYLVFNFGSPLMQRDSTGQQIEHLKSIFRGKGKNAVLFEQTENINIFGISFHPWGIYPFVKSALHEFNASILPASDLLEPELEEKLHEKPFTEQKQIAENWLLGKLADEKFISPVVISSASYVIHQNGRIRIKDISEKYNISLKHLERTFAEVTGFTPKQFASLQRINGVIEHLKMNPQPDWIGLVEHFRFYDQAHFSKEFKTHTGTTPSQFIKAKDTIFENYIQHFEFI